MHLKQFSVKGFKNFRQKIILEEMGAICVIHGENNIGKSNVLEAMQLFFQLLKVQYQHRLVLCTEMTFSEIKQLGIIANDIFNLEIPGAIKLNATFDIEANELKKAGIE
jgi:AAA15 family ATPase/GTPase